MPLIEISGSRHYYRIDGPDHAPVLVFSHSLGCDHSQWDEQARQFQNHFRVLRYDLRGHGASDATPGDYSIEMLGRDVLALTTSLGIDRFAFCGLSIGGMVGQWLGAFAQDRVTSLVLANTLSRHPAPDIMEDRRKAVLKEGMTAVTDGVMQRFFTAASLASNSVAVAGIRRLVQTSNPVGYAGCCAAVRDLNLTHVLASIHAPTLIIAGDFDQSTPWHEHGETLAREIPRARIEHLPTAHLSNIERPHSFNAALFRFLIPAPSDALSAGMEKRRRILGDAHVDKAIANTTGFSRDFQEWITRCAWGNIWQRPALDDATRRLLVLAVTASLGRWEEFKLHVRTGLQHELEPCDLEELLLQLAVYAGVPAANTGFQIAAGELEA